MVTGLNINIYIFGPAVPLTARVRPPYFIPEKYLPCDNTGHLSFWEGVPNCAVGRKKNNGVKNVHPKNDYLRVDPRNRNKINFRALSILVEKLFCIMDDFNRLGYVGNFANFVLFEFILLICIIVKGHSRSYVIYDMQ